MEGPGHHGFEERLSAYAAVAVGVGINLQPGQRLIVEAPISTAPFVRAAARYAYDAGARLVDVFWRDDALKRIRFEHAPRDSFEEYPAWRPDAIRERFEAGDAYLYILADDPSLLEGQNPKLVSLAQRTEDAHNQACLEYLAAGRVNWTAMSIPIPAWADRVFADHPANERRMAMLWEAIFDACRITLEDPVAAWREHTADLKKRREHLTERGYTALHFHGPGTDLKVGLVPGHVWVGGATTTPTGVEHVPNMPTEEVFTLPHRKRVDGVVTATRPLCYAGQVIDGFSMVLKEGRVVELRATNGEALLRELLATDDGASRLGEVALVPDTSPISRTGLLFHNTLFDENAACHLAFGTAIRVCLPGGEELSDEGFAAAGGNSSMTHVDFMVGSDRLDVDGLRADATVEPIFRDGEWATGC